jgi:hypothetical protein
VCKHLLFVLYRALKFTLVDIPLPSTVDEIPFSYIKENYRRSDDSKDDVAGEDETSDQDSEQDCSICFETLYISKPKEPLVNCTSQCRNYFHAKCMEVWRTKQVTGTASCPLCRAPISKQCCVCLEFQPKAKDGHTFSTCQLCRYCFHQRENVTAATHRTQNCTTKH